MKYRDFLMNTSLMNTSMRGGVIVMGLSVISFILGMVAYGRIDRCAEPFILLGMAVFTVGFLTYASGWAEREGSLRRQRSEAEIMMHKLREVERLIRFLAPPIPPPLPKHRSIDDSWD